MVGGLTTRQTVLNSAGERLVRRKKARASSSATLPSPSASASWNQPSRKEVAKLSTGTKAVSSTGGDDEGGGGGGRRPEEAPNDCRGVKSGGVSGVWGE